LSGKLTSHWSIEAVPVNGVGDLGFMKLENRRPRSSTTASLVAARLDAVEVARFSAGSRDDSRASSPTTSTLARVGSPCIAGGQHRPEAVRCRRMANREACTKTRRSWRKLHLGVDAETGQIVAATLTSKEVDDAAQVGPMLDQVIGSLSSVTADEPMTRMAFTPMLAPIIPTRR
jgi:hypothetical protein